MVRKVMLIFLVSVFFSTAVFPQTVLKKLTISVNKNLSLVATPGIARNEAVDEWLVTWELTTPARRNVLGRLVKSNGDFASKTKTLVRNVLSHAIAYNSVDHTYLILYGTSTGLRGQLFTENLIRRGTFVAIATASVTGSFPVGVTYSAVDNTFLAVWMPSRFNGFFGTSFPTLNAVILDSLGNPLAEPRILVQTPEDEFGIGSLGRGVFTVSRNEVKNRSLVMLDDGNSRLVGYHVQPDGSLLNTTPIVFQLAALDAGQCSFARDGSGFASWVSNSSFRLRRISPEGVATSPAKQISKLHGGPTLLFDSLHNQYFSAWLSTKNVLVGGIHSRTTGALKGKPFIIEDLSSHGRLQLLNSSYDSKRGNALVAWVEESTAATGRIRLRAALLKLDTHQAPTPSNLNGTWEGKTGHSRSLDFEVKGNVISRINFGWSIYNAECNMSGNKTFVDLPISDNKFSLEFLDSDDIQYIIKGTFTSGTTAKGTLNVEALHSFCGPSGESTTTWTAIKK